MASARDLYRKALLSAKNLGTKTIIGKITAVYPETVKGSGKDDGDKLVIELDDDVTRIALNKGNAENLMASFGDEYDEWVGKKVKVTCQNTQYMGNPTKGLLVAAAGK